MANDERSQLFICTHNVTLSIVAVCVRNPDRSSLAIQAATQPKLHPAFGKSNQITDATRAVVALNRGWRPRESTVFGH